MTDKGTFPDNRLFPVFLKLEELRVLLIGAGNVGLEKLNGILSQAPETHIKVIAKEVLPEIRQMAQRYPNVEIIQTDYDISQMEDRDIVFSAVNDFAVSEKIRADATKMGKLLNAADKPALCDFYLGSVVSKGNLKVAISTNGTSPTVAKRLKEIFLEVLPDELDEVLLQLQEIRQQLKGDLPQKVARLNEITKVLVTTPEGNH